MIASPSAMAALLEEKLETKLRNIDKSSLRGEHKVSIYSRYALPSLRFYMSVHHIHKVHQEKLDTIARRYLKSWLRIPSRGATDASLFHPNMLNLKAPSTMYLEAHANNYTQMRMKGDNIVNHLLDSRLERESLWKKKYSTIVTVDSMYKENIEKNKINEPQENTDINKKSRTKRRQVWRNG